MRLGVLTIGQSPRDDVVPEMAAFWPGVDVIQSGALDGLPADEVLDLAPAEGEYVLVTRLRDGTGVKVGKERLAGRMQDALSALADSGCAAVLLLCTGQFAGFRSAVPIIRPQQILHGTVEAMAAGVHLGVMLPAADQLPQAQRRWRDVAGRLSLAGASPYAESDEVEAAARRFRRLGVELTVMDCMGYTAAMRALVRGTTGRPVLLARNVVARVVAELFNDK